MGETEPIEVKAGERYGELPVLTKKGYIFDGWWTERNGEGIKITSDSIVTKSETPTRTLYANWLTIYDARIKPSYKLSFENASFVEIKINDDIYALAEFFEGETTQIYFEYEGVEALQIGNVLYGKDGNIADNISPDELSILKTITDYFKEYAPIPSDNWVYAEQSNELIILKRGYEEITITNEWIKTISLTPDTTVLYHPVSKISVTFYFADETQPLMPILPNIN